MIKRFIDLTNLQLYDQLIKEYILSQDQAVLEASNTIFTSKGSVSSTSSLPNSGNTVGDCYLVEGTGEVYGWNGSAWAELGFADALIPATDAQIDAIFE